MSGDDFIAPHCAQQIEIIFEDNYLLVIDKPSGLLSLSGKNPLNKDSVHYRLVQQYPTATMVHRLDLGTSGLMVLALNKKVNAHLTKQFQARTIAKQYIACLYGHLAADEGVIDAPIAKARFPYQKVCYETGKVSQSHYRVIERCHDTATGTNSTRVSYSTKTGRTHQLRVHSLEIGHPIIGCDLYGLNTSGINTRRLSKRLCLHASDLSFDHPVNGDRMVFESKCDF